MIHFGATRAVVLFGPWAFKFARSYSGVRCNRREADLFHRNKNKAHRRPLLCPVLWCSWPAIVLIMRRALTPENQAQIDKLKTSAWFDWDYMGPNDDECPFEWKPSDWGILNGSSVAVDYAATALAQLGEYRPPIR